MGITSTLTGNASEVLGGLKYGTTPLQMADAYATIADGGIHHSPTIIGKVVFPDHSTENFGNPKGTRVFSYAESYAADQVLKEVLTHPGATAYGSSYGCPAAGKTGTANNLANAWFVGYDPRVATGVWVGNPLGDTYLNNGYGGVLAAPIWKQYMQEESNGYCGDWPAPAVPFTGKAFTGAHSPTSVPSSGYGSTGSTGTGGTGTGSTGTGSTGTGSTSTPNPTTPTPTTPATGATTGRGKGAGATGKTGGGAIGGGSAG
jgi:penicillin-binding protein 1A